MKNNKGRINISAIIQARITSTRLPGKVFLNISDKPMLWHVVERLKFCKTLDEIILAIPDTKENDILEEFAKKNKIKYFRGDEEDVLSRYYKTAKKFKCDIIVRITSDCPLIDPTIIDKCVKKFLKGKYDYISNFFQDDSDFPRGLDVRVFSFKALKKAYWSAIETYEREHVAPYIWENKNNEFKIGPVIKAPSEYACNYRLVIDYLEDFILIEKIYQIFYKKGHIIDTRKVIKFLYKHPEIAQININCQQKPFRYEK
jgi:spore coat polysaccharide biosynthesis protein SpsF